MRRKWLLAGFVLTAALTAFFAVRAIMFAVYWMDPERGHHPVEPWMTPRYIVRAYDIPREVLAETLNLEPGDSPKMPLDKLARERGTDVMPMVQAVQALVDARPEGPPPDHMPPPPPPPPPGKAPAKP
jgi:hypothetical protein